MTADPITYAPARPGAPRLRLVTAPPYVPVPICVCGHEPDTHDPAHDPADGGAHTGCGMCGPARCRSFRRRTGRGARRR